MCNCCRFFVTFHHHLQARSNNNKHFFFHSIANTYRLAISTPLQDVQQQKCSTIKREHDALNIGETKTKNMKHIEIKMQSIWTNK
jgi:hypothetical protein